jgi:hypothetical protein
MPATSNAVFFMISSQDIHPTKYFRDVLFENILQSYLSLFYTSPIFLCPFSIRPLFSILYKLVFMNKIHIFFSSQFNHVFRKSAFAEKNIALLSRPLLPINI